MMMTSFWHPNGTPMSAQQFMEMLFGKLPLSDRPTSRWRAQEERLMRDRDGFQRVLAGYQPAPLAGETACPTKPVDSPA
jgi:hypothetical protein